MLPAPKPSIMVFRHGPAARLLAVFLGFWLWMMPQVLNGRSTMNDDLAQPAPVNEEEETKHANALPLVIIGHVPAPDRNSQHPPLDPTVAPLCGAQGEVPHPPPWWIIVA